MSTRVRSGEVVIGGLLVLIGTVLFLSRLGLMSWDGRWLFWPAILMGLGLARLAESPSGGPYRGLLLITAGVWLLGVQAGWFVIEGSWPLLVIALGVAIAVGGRRATRPPDTDRREAWHPTPLAIIGMWVAIVLAAHTPGLGSFVRQSVDGDTLHVFTFTGESNVRPTPPVERADVITFMGKSRIDLEAASPGPGGRVVLDVVTMWGETLVRVPDGWIVEPRVTSLLAGLRDRRANRARPGTNADPAAPHVTLRGVVMMGNIVIAD